MVNERVGASNWEDGKELGDTWASRNAFSYGRYVYESETSHRHSDRTIPSDCSSLTAELREDLDEILGDDEEGFDAWSYALSKITFYQLHAAE